jgi:prevent-host-death family protein
MKIAMNQLKAGLSRYVAQASAGQVIEITSHDKPVARLTGVPQAAPVGVANLIAHGLATWSGRKLVLPTPVHLSVGGVAVSQMVIEDRG